MTHLHLDLVGGLAGDMFISALLDCTAISGQELQAVLVKAGFDNLVTLASEAFNDGVLTGKTFKVREIKTTGTDHDHHHNHRHYHQIQKIINESELAPEIKSIALEIFHIIAVAEAQIHDKPVTEVAFHEVGAWDSIADVVCASYLIHRLDIRSCSCSAIPLGSGQVKTAHGMLPVPAPATALILEGFEFVDDGIPGERVTPTGAAILKYLKPSTKPRAALKGQGFGFGTKKMPGISNTVRALLLEAASDDGTSQEWQSEVIHSLEFEIDDQTPEQLASALDGLRRQNAVLDVIQYPVYGKKNRLSHAIRVLAQSDIRSIIADCFRHTSTLGIRHSKVTRHTLDRTQVSIEHGEKSYSVKIANRPGGDTAKMEMDELQGLESASKLAELRRAIESSALDTHKESTE